MKFDDNTRSRILPYWNFLGKPGQEKLEKEAKEVSDIMSIILGDEDGNADLTAMVAELIKIRWKGNPDVLWMLGFCHELGLGVSKDPNQAIAFYKDAAEKEHPAALNNLGWFCQNGPYVIKNIELGLNFFQRAAEKELSAAQCNLGNCYKNGIGIPKDPKKAVELYTMAEEKEHPNARYVLGSCYYHGEGVREDRKRALDFFQRGLGTVEVLNHIHPALPYLITYYKSDLGGIQPDPLRVRMLETGEEDARKRLFQSYVEAGTYRFDTILGFCYQLGLGAKQDLNKACVHYVAAIQRGEPCLLDLYFCYRTMKVPKEIFLSFYQQLKHYSALDGAQSTSTNTPTANTITAASLVSSVSTAVLPLPPISKMVDATKIPEITERTPYPSLKQEASLCLAYFYDYGATYFEQDTLKALELYQRHKAENEQEKKKSNSIVKKKTAEFNNYIRTKCELYSKWKTTYYDVVMNVLCHPQHPKDVVSNPKKPKNSVPNQERFTTALGRTVSSTCGNGKNSPANPPLLRDLGHVVILYAFHPMQLNAEIGAQSPESNAVTTAAVASEATVSSNNRCLIS